MPATARYRDAALQPQPPGGTLLVNRSKADTEDGRSKRQGLSTNKGFWNRNDKCVCFFSMNKEVTKGCPQVVAAIVSGPSRSGSLMERREPLCAISCDGPATLATVTSWMGLMAGVMTLILWCFLLPASKVRLSIAPDNFLSDVNETRWRQALFSFTPDVFVDLWTPFVFGAVSVSAHFNNFDLHMVTGDFFRFFLWNLVMALFANMGYAGGLGIICGSFTLLVAFFALVCLCACNGSAKLNLDPFAHQEPLDF
ncbi:hypothetical protein Esti_002647 [Eimeria stiedai]